MSIKEELINFIRNKHYGGMNWVSMRACQEYMDQLKGTNPVTTTRRLQELVADKRLEKSEETGYKRFKVL